jgi:uncharacterized protein with WD repeat
MRKVVTPNRRHSVGAQIDQRSGNMDITDEVRRVLNIVRQVLRERTTDWVGQGQPLMEAIEAAVKKA